ncbi:hypothetical protein [Fulvivirga maritima]|nr:hypothetical protein [Fulvivirga maritima]
MSLIDDLQWRYATKKMDGSAVAEDKVDFRGNTYGTNFYGSAAISGFGYN